MRDDTSGGRAEARDGGGRRWPSLGLPLEELVRRGARDILQRAIEAEVDVPAEEFAWVSLLDRRAPGGGAQRLPAGARDPHHGGSGGGAGAQGARPQRVGVKFNSALAPPYVRRSARVAAALPWLYLKGISSGDLGEALEVLVGDGAKGLSPAALGRLKAQWSEEYQGWTRRSLEGKEYAYVWVDGIDTPLRGSEDPEAVPAGASIGVTADGTKEWVAIADGLRESTGLLARRLRDLKGAGPEGRTPPGRRRRRIGLLVGPGAGLSRDAPTSAAGSTRWATCSRPCPRVPTGQGESGSRRPILDGAHPPGRRRRPSSAS